MVNVYGLRLGPGLGLGLGLGLELGLGSGLELGPLSLGLFLYHFMPYVGLTYTYRHHTVIGTAIHQTNHEPR
jgi:hypothetical protein